jgi:hypothetical protein
MGLGAAFDRAGIDANVLYVIQVEGDPPVRQQRASGKVGNRVCRRFGAHRVAPYEVMCDTATLVVIG